MKDLFSTCTFSNGVIAPNRLVAQPMEGNDATSEGSVSTRAYDRYKKLAEGEWGIVIVEALSVTSVSLARKHGMVLSRKNLDDYKRLVEEFRKLNPDSLLVFQLTHSGMKTGDFSERVTLTPDAPPGFRYLSTGEIEQIRDKFIDAAVRAQEAGADGIDIKCCHGYFGAEMLRPSNIRRDTYGGSYKNRTRFLREVASGVQQRCDGKNFLIGSRLSVYEGIRGGCGTAGPEEIMENLDEMCRLAEDMGNMGMQYVNVSAGVPGVTSEITRPVTTGQYLALSHLRYAKEVKKCVSRGFHPAKTIGSAYSIFNSHAASLADENIKKGYTDLAGWGRMSFSDPLYPKKIAAGEKINYCKACSKCSKLLAAQEPTGCALYYSS